MIVLVTESFNTAKGIIRAGKIIEIPDTMFNRLRGKVEAIPPEAETNTTATTTDMTAGRRRALSDRTDSIPVKDTINHGPYVMPYINKNNDLVIPFDADAKYFSWAGGQSLEATLTELNLDGTFRAKYSS